MQHTNTLVFKETSKIKRIIKLKSLPVSVKSHVTVENKKNILYNFDSEQNLIYVIDEDSTTVFRKIVLKTKTKYDNIFVIHKDSICLVQNKNNVIDQYDSLGRLSISYDLNPSKTTMNSLENKTEGVLLKPQIGNRKIYKIDQHLYLNAQPTYFAKELFSTIKMMIRLNLETREVDYVFDYPDFFHKYDWPISYYFGKFVIYDEKSKRFIFSFYMSDSLYTYDVQTQKMNSFFAGSNYIEIDYTLKESIANEEGARYMRNHSNYATLRFDPFRKLYYRTTDLVNTRAIQEDKVTPFTKPYFSIIILDENLNRLGESEIFTDAYNGAFKIREDALYILSAQSNREEDVCHVYQIVENR